MAQSPAIALSAFSTDAQGVTHVTIPVDGDTTPTGPATGPRTGLPAGRLRQRLSGQGHATDSSARARRRWRQLVTYLVYDDPSSTSQPLRLALVVPLGLGPARGRP